MNAADIVVASIGIASVVLLVIVLVLLQRVYKVVKREEQAQQKAEPR